MIMASSCRTDPHAEALNDFFSCLFGRVEPVIIPSLTDLQNYRSVSNYHQKGLEFLNESSRQRPVSLHTCKQPTEINLKRVKIREYIFQSQVI